MHAFPLWLQAAAENMQVPGPTSAVEAAFQELLAFDQPPTFRTTLTHMNSSCLCPSPHLPPAATQPAGGDETLGRETPIPLGAASHPVTQGPGHRLGSCWCCGSDRCLCRCCRLRCRCCRTTGPSSQSRRSPSWNVSPACRVCALAAPTSCRSANTSTHKHWRGGSVWVRD